jgi:GNAT superfamily N-acetyltransferase
LASHANANWHDSRMSRAAAHIRRARPADGPRLCTVALSSKAHWGYAESKVRGWADSLDLSPERLGAGELLVAEVDGQIAGWAEVVPPVDGVCVLEHLWIEPAWMGRGLGSRLFRCAQERARELGASVLEWEAEPNAAGFYAKMGGRHLRETTSEWGLPLSVMGVAAVPRRAKA